MPYQRLILQVELLLPIPVHFGELLPGLIMLRLLHIRLVVLQRPTLRHCGEQPVGLTVLLQLPTSANLSWEKAYSALFISPAPATPI